MVAAPFAAVGPDALEPPPVLALTPFERRIEWGLSRWGALPLACIGGALASVSSAALCYTIFAVFSPASFAVPLAVILPAAVPFALATPSIYFRLRTHAKLKVQRELISRQNRLLAESTREKDRILAIIGHDLRGQLNVIIGFAELIHGRGDRLQLETILDYAEQIATAANTTNGILSDLLELGRFKAGTVTFAPKPLEVAAFAHHAASVMQPHADSKGITLRSTGGQGQAEVDSELIQTALRNLIGNAIKFTPRGGTITVSLEAPGPEAIIVVADTGIGMDPGQLERVRQAEIGTSSPGTDGEQGTGLGLAICREIVHRHKGELAIDSTPGKGTTVTVRLPKIHPRDTASQIAAD